MAQRIIGIIGYNLFSSGGTSRSNINLIKEFNKEGYEVIFFNSEPYSKLDSTRLKLEEHMCDMEVSFQQLNNLNRDFGIETFIITRESMFIYAKSLRKFFANAVIIGEVHGPLSLISDTIDLSLDYIDCIRVSTSMIAKQFEEKYQFSNVFSLNVSLEHINTKFERIDAKTNNFMIYSRFEDDVKDISYAIKLIHYLVNILGKSNFKLYVNGYGPSELLYKNLINYFNLQNNVFLNEEIPEEYTYLSTSRFETFGYSIMEALADGHLIVTFEGEDSVLKDIYKDIKSVGWISKNIQYDASYIMNFLNQNSSKKQYIADMKLVNKRFYTDEYSKQYWKLVEDILKKERIRPLEYKVLENNELIKKENKKDKIEKLKEIRIRLSSFPVLDKIVNHPPIINLAKKIFIKNENYGTIENQNLIKPKTKYFFIESFHGSNFSGDPKYLALAIKNKLPQACLFVSSKNQLVDMEIRNFGFEPVRTGSKKYQQMFAKCQTVIVNGNTLDALKKHPEQRIIQTWHGFPLKKMVNDLENEKERVIQNTNFIPRMLKWDYLLTSSELNTDLLQSAFNLDKNKQLKIIEKGLPKNQYLIEKKDDVNELEKLQFKYFYKDKKGVTFILYCPTWRADKRKKVSQLNLEKVIERLPKEYEIIVKLHPLESHLRKFYKDLHPRIHCFYNELVDIQELYLLSDCLISDYSSAIFDYAHTGKKIVVLQEDEAAYQNKVGFYFNLEKVTGLKGNHYDECSLVEAIRNTKQSYQYNQAIVSQLLTADTLDTTTNLLEQLEIDLGGKK